MESTLQLAMKLDPREVNHHLSTVFWQMEVTKFLHSCELEQRHVMDLIPGLLQPLQSSGIFGTKLSSCSVPTLFGSNIERMQLAVLVMVCGKTVDEGFGLAFRIIKDYHLKASQIYSLAGKKLVCDGRFADIEQLIFCIQSSGLSETSSVCDDVLVQCVHTLAEKRDSTDMEPLIKLIVDPGRKISAYIKCRQLKSAYLLAVKYSRLDDVRKILHEAQKLGQTKMQQICLKRLGQQVET
ncbi:hypothetical protein Cfor_07107 [Coptotermes formosanus]|uniref:ZFYVE26-like TPR repeats domain-containing protein n=1 Tax=Coptotermes formosanus TaxID=36987 RepID=A0A6L2Q6Z9_COPFO|nr:hypothetical protein Cfor_07107 [Coptotermes formosanus]